MRCGVLTPARSLNLTLSLASPLRLPLTRLPCCELAPGEVACATCAQNHTSAVADVACGAAATRLDDTLTVAHLRAERAAERAALRAVAEVRVRVRVWVRVRFGLGLGLGIGLGSANPNPKANPKPNRTKPKP